MDWEFPSELLSIFSMKVGYSYNNIRLSQTWEKKCIIYHHWLHIAKHSVWHYNLVQTQTAF